MTKTGYSLKRPTLKANYIKILQTLYAFNAVDVAPTRKQLKETVGISHDQGFDKALNALLKAGEIEEIENTDKLLANTMLIDEAAENTAKHYGIW